MNRKRTTDDDAMTNAQAATTTTHHNVYDHRSKAKYEPPAGGQLPLWLRVGHWLGITMASTENPRGWQLNPATVTLALVVLGMVAAGSYYMGQRDSDARQLIERLDKIERTAQQAKDLSIAASSQTGPGHETVTTTDPKKKEK